MALILARQYATALSELGAVRFLTEPEYAKSNYWFNAMVLERDDTIWRDQVLQFLHRQGVRVRPLWNLMHSLPMYASCPRMDLSCAESLGRRVINLPSSAFLASIRKAPTS